MIPCPDLRGSRRAALAARRRKASAEAGGASHGAAAPKKEMTVPFKPGETLDYDVGWSSFVTAGTRDGDREGEEGVLRLDRLLHRRRGPADAARVEDLHALLQGRHADRRVHAAAAARIDLQRGRQAPPDEDDGLRPGGEEGHLQDPDADAGKKDFAIPGFTQDALSAIYVLRSIPFKPGEKFNMPVSDNGNIYKVQMQVGAVEPVKTGMGTINGDEDRAGHHGTRQDSPRGLALWISDDARRLPLKMEAQLLVGKFTITLAAGERAGERLPVEPSGALCRAPVRRDDTPDIHEIRPWDRTDAAVRPRLRKPARCTTPAILARYSRDYFWNEYLPARRRAGRARRLRSSIDGGTRPCCSSCATQAPGRGACSKWVPGRGCF